MKHFAICLVNKVTGDIEHMVTSDMPLTDEQVGTPENAATTHQIQRFEFDADADSGANIMRARSALAEFEMTGANAAAKSSPGALVRQTVGRDRATNIMIGRQYKPA